MAREAHRKVRYSGASAQSMAAAVEEVGALGTDRYDDLLLAVFVARFLALDDERFAIAIGIDIAGRAQMLGHVDSERDVDLTGTGRTEMLRPDAKGHDISHAPAADRQGQARAAVIEQLDGRACRLFLDDPRGEEVHPRR